MISKNARNSDLRLVVQQLALPHYRLPVFRGLAQLDGIDFRLVYSSTDGLANHAPDGFSGESVPALRWRLAGCNLIWHHPQYHYATRRCTDILVLSWDLHYASLIPALLRAKLSGVATILWGHGYSKHEAVWRSYARRKVARLATALLFYNHTTAQRYIDQWGEKPERIHVALNSIDQAPIEAAKQHWLGDAQRMKSFRAANGLNDGPTILFVSRLDSDNRLDLLLHSTAALIHKFPGLKVVIIGKGVDEKHLRDLSAALELTQQVRFLGAIYNDMELAPWFLASDLFCYPANIGLSILHAFGYGLPVVTSDRIESQNPEIDALRHEQNGLLYEDGNAAALTAAVERILSDMELAKRMSAEATRTVREEFTVQRMVAGFEEAARYCAATLRPA
jgi:glycosyltransferase involved in cell wall biosynthesis